MRLMPMTLDKVLTYAETLPRDEQEMLEDLLRKRRIEAWRHETAAEASKAVKAFRVGKLKAEPVETVIGRLRAGLRSETE
jgi:hypothetical protein